MNEFLKRSLFGLASVSLMCVLAVGCGGDEDAAMDEHEGHDHDKMEMEEQTADTSKIPFTTSLSDTGSITLQPHSDSAVSVPLTSYQVSGLVPKDSVVSGVIMANTYVHVQSITAIGSNPAWPGSQNAPGITDQPVGLGQIENEEDE